MKNSFTDCCLQEEGMANGLSAGGAGCSVHASLEQSIYAALETYSNVHRGSGHFSKATTRLFDRAREIVLEYLGLKKNSYHVVFGTHHSAKVISETLMPGSFTMLSSRDFGLMLGVVAVVSEKRALPSGTPFASGGGTTKLYGADWVIWLDPPARFEAGTPAILNIIGFATALLMIQQCGKDIFRNEPVAELTAEYILQGEDSGGLSGKELLDEIRRTLPGGRLSVPTTEGMKPFINFDNAASTPAFADAWNSFRLAYRQPEHVRNDIIREVRSICSRFLNAPLPEYDILFTSNTTESINLVARSLAGETNEEVEPVILTTILEHSSNDLPWRTVPGHTLLRLEADNDGVFNLTSLELLLAGYNEQHRHGNKRIRLVAVCGASNVLGTCNDLTAIGRTARRYGARFLVDAAQLIAHRKIDVMSSGIDYLAFSAHKVYAPFGTGVLVAGKGLLRFDEKEWKDIHDSGEENVGGIAAIGKTLILLQRIGLDLIREQEGSLVVNILQRMSEIPGVTVFGTVPDKPETSVDRTGVILFDVKKKMGSLIARKLARRSGTGIRFGCHCAHLIIKQILGFTPFQERFQRMVVKLVPALNLQGMARVSIGIQNTGTDADILINEVKRIAGAGENNNRTDKIPVKVVKKQISEFISERERLVYGCRQEGQK